MLTLTMTWCLHSSTLFPSVHVLCAKGAPCYPSAYLLLTPLVLRVHPIGTPYSLHWYSVLSAHPVGVDTPCSSIHSLRHLDQDAWSTALRQCSCHGVSNRSLAGARFCSISNSNGSRQETSYQDGGFSTARCGVRHVASGSYVPGRMS